MLEIPMMRINCEAQKDGKNGEQTTHLENLDETSKRKNIEA